MRLSLGPCGRALLMRGVQRPVVAARALQTSTGRRETYSKLKKFVLLAKDSLYTCIIKERSVPVSNKKSNHKLYCAKGS